MNQEVLEIEKNFKIKYESLKCTSWTGYKFSSYDYDLQGKNDALEICAKNIYQFINPYEKVNVELEIVPEDFEDKNIFKISECYPGEANSKVVFKNLIRDFHISSISINRLKIEDAKKLFNKKVKITISQ